MTAQVEHRRLLSLVVGQPNPMPPQHRDLPVELTGHPWAPFWRPASRHTCALLLEHPLGTNGYGRTVGLRYSEILDVLAELRPGDRTSAATLRWYAVQMRAGDLPDETGRSYERALPQYRPHSQFHRR